MAVREREYLLTTNRLKEPEVVTGHEAIGILLTRLIMMEPGTDPLHPDMGVGIARYRYGMDNKEELRKRIESQITTYLPYFQESDVTLIYCPDHTVNIEITLDNVTYVYESGESSIPIYTLDDIPDEEI